MKTKVFLDANILIAVLNKEYPVYSYAARVLSLADHTRYELYTSPLCLAIAFYYAEKKSKKTARSRIEMLAAKIGCTTVDESIVSKAVKDESIADFEDALQYHSAKEAGCSVIVTEDKSDFYYASLRVSSSKEFLEQEFRYGYYR